MASVITTAVLVSVLTFVLQIVSSIPVEINGSGDVDIQLLGEITTSQHTFQRGKRAMKVSGSQSCSSHNQCNRGQCCAFSFGRKICKDSQKTRKLGETCSIFDVHKYLDLNDLTRSFTTCPLVCRKGLRCRATQGKSRKRIAVCSRR